MKKKLLIALGIFAALVIVMLFAVTDGLSEGAKVMLQGIDLSSVSDGSYTGTYDFKRWTNTVIVTVKDHEIIRIASESNVFGDKLANELTDRVIVAQNTRVDAVSGATVSSKAYLKAIENALGR